MKTLLTHALAVTGLALCTQAIAQVTLYEHGRFRGEAVTIDRPAGSLERYNFNSRGSSAVVNGEAWEFCDAPGFSGRCVVLQPGQHDSLGDLNDSVRSMRPLSARGGPVAGGPAPYPQGPRGPDYGSRHRPSAGLTLFEHRDFGGASLVVERPRRRLERADFDNVASSAIVSGGSWQVCDGEEFSGRCVVLRPGRYPTLAQLGLSNRISSARPVER